jgi:hypothetical protein
MYYFLSLRFFYAGEIPDIENSISSINSHTVNLTADIDENCALNTNIRSIERHVRAITTADAIETLRTSTAPRTIEENDIII